MRWVIFEAYIYYLFVDDGSNAQYKIRKTSTTTGRCVDVLLAMMAALLVGMLFEIQYGPDDSKFAMSHNVEKKLTNVEQAAELFRCKQEWIEHMLDRTIWTPDFYAYERSWDDAHWSEFTFSEPHYKMYLDPKEHLNVRHNLTQTIASIKNITECVNALYK